MGLFTALDDFLHSAVDNLGAPAIYAILLGIIALLIAAFVWFRATYYVIKKQPSKYSKHWSATR